MKTKTLAHCGHERALLSKDKLQIVGQSEFSTVISPDCKVDE